MPIHCRSCRSPLRGLEVIADGGSAILFMPTGQILVQTEDDQFDWSSPRWLCRYLDGYPCFNCETVDLAVADRQLLLETEGRYLPRSDRTCPACDIPCLGPRPLDCDGVPGVLLAFLDHQFGAPLAGHLCPSCGRVWLSLYPDDSQARAELAKRFPDSGRCPSCKKGRRRVTRLDAPHAGFVALREPAPPAKPGRTVVEGRRVAGLLAAICDRCGEATTHPESEQPRRAVRRRPR